MGKFVDLTGQKFNRLTVIKRAKNIGKSTAWYCSCDCGTRDVIVTSDNLKHGNVKSCGCLKRETSAKNGKKYKGVSNLKNKKYNTYDLSGEYGIGYASNGKEFLFDLEDYDRIKDYCWWINDNGYVVATVHNSKNIRMHRLLMDESNPKNIIDHINHNTTDNRKSNLRHVTKSENCMNQIVRSNNTSGVTGVHFDKTRNKWLASIMVDYKDISLGRYDTFEEAVNVRKEAEDRYFGEYSYGNSMKIVSNY